MYIPTSVLENDTQKPFRDFDIQIDHLISARQRDLIIINNKKKRICKIVDFAVSADHRKKLRELILYCHLQHHNDTIINSRRKTSLEKYLYLSLYLYGFERVVWGFTVRASWRPNRNFNILTSTLMAGNVVSFSFTWCSTGGPEAHSAGWWLSLLHIISNFSGPQRNREPRAPLAWRGFPYHILKVGGRVETIQTTALLRTAWDESRRLEEICCHSNSSERPSANTDVKNSKGVKNNWNLAIRTSGICTK